MFHLVCIHPWGPYKRGAKVTEPSEVARLSKTRDRHFVRVPAQPVTAPQEVEVDGVEYARVGKKK